MNENISGSWLSILDTSLQMISEDEFVDPTDPIEEGNTVEGIMSLEEKRLYTYTMQLTKRMYALNGDIMFSGGTGDTPAKEIMRDEMSSLKAKADIARKLMFNSIQDRLNLWGKSVGIRGEFQVVSWNEPESSSNPLSNLKRLLGGMGDE